ncbi:MAG: hypothetical protein ACOVSI_08245, partial [Gemmatimonas sp.]
MTIFKDDAQVQQPPGSAATSAHRPVRLATLLDQQLWYIGHDTRHADGNALLRFGFERSRTPAGGTSCYRLSAEDPTRQVVCWGFGVYVGPVAEESDVSLIRPQGTQGCSLQRGVF